MAAGLRPAPLVSGIGMLLVVIVGISRLDALLLLLLFFPAGFSLTDGLLLILLLGLSLTVVDGLVRLRSRCNALPFGLPLGCLLLIRVEGPSRLRFKESGSFMMNVFSLCLGRMLFSCMSLLMQVMSLVHGLSGLVLLKLRSLTLISSVGSYSEQGLVLGRESALFRVVRLGGQCI